MLINDKTIEEENAAMINSAINKIANILYRSVYSYNIDEINKTSINYISPEYRSSRYYSKDYVFRLIKYAYENKKEYFIAFIEEMVKRANANCTREDLIKLREAFLVLGFESAVENYREISLKPITNINRYLIDLGIHDEIYKVSKNLLDKGSYPQAIFESFKRVISMVKEKAKNQLEIEEGKKGKELDGKDLMFKVFDIDKPLLKINELKTQSEKDEQDGFKHIFAGAVEGIRNPMAHDIVNTEDLNLTLHYIILASLLARIVDKAKPVDENIERDK